MLTANAMKLLIVLGPLVTLATSGMAQTVSTDTGELRVVDLQQNDDPPTGPHGIVVEHDPGLATHTIYRPREFGASQHPVLVWGEGGCANNGLMFPEYLSEIASHGFVVIADGPPGSLGTGAGGPNGAAARAGGPPPGALPLGDPVARRVGRVRPTRAAW